MNNGECYTFNDQYHYQGTVEGIFQTLFFASCKIDCNSNTMTFYPNERCGGNPTVFELGTCFDMFGIFGSVIPYLIAGPYLRTYYCLGRAQKRKALHCNRSSRCRHTFSTTSQKSSLDKTLKGVHTAGISQRPITPPHTNLNSRQGQQICNVTPQPTT